MCGAYHSVANGIPICFVEAPPRHSTGYMKTFNRGSPQVLLFVSAVVCGVHGASSKSSSFGYAVSDSNTRDFKDQQEIKRGDSVVGYYRLADSDGMLRTVNYKADPRNGFTAHVDRSPGLDVSDARSMAAPVALPYSLVGWPNTWPAPPADRNAQSTTQ